MITEEEFKILIWGAIHLIEKGECEGICPSLIRSAKLHKMDFSWLPGSSSTPKWLLPFKPTHKGKGSIGGRSTQEEDRNA